jgi:hypothetical protein
MAPKDIIPYAFHDIDLVVEKEETPKALSSASNASASLTEYWARFDFSRRAAAFFLRGEVTMIICTMIYACMAVLAKVGIFAKESRCVP